MLNVHYMIAHGLWILGAAAWLAALSYCQWLAAERRTPLREIWRHCRGLRTCAAIGAFMIGQGLLLVQGRSWGEQSLWLLACGAMAFQLWRETRRVN